MRILLYELKKLWNWRILALIAVIGALTWFAFLSEALRSYDSLTTHGIYGSYQNEMFTLYGERQGRKAIGSRCISHYDSLAAA